MYAQPKSLYISPKVSHFYGTEYALLQGLTIDSIVQNFVFFPEALTRKSKTIAYMENLL